MAFPADRTPPGLLHLEPFAAFGERMANLSRHLSRQAAAIHSALAPGLAGDAPPATGRPGGKPAPGRVVRRVKMPGGTAAQPAQPAQAAQPAQPAPRAIGFGHPL